MCGQVYDFVREKIIHNVTHHTKAVYGFVWCSAYSMFASCGLEREVILWQVGDAQQYIFQIISVESLEVFACL